MTPALDRRIRGLLAAGVDPVEVCCRLLVGWATVRRVHFIFSTGKAVEKMKTASSTVPSPSPLPPPAPPQERGMAIDEAVRFLRGKHHQVVRMPDGSFLLNDREADADAVIRRAERTRARLARAEEERLDALRGGPPHAAG